VTLEREQEFDYSVPVGEAGQQVMVRDTGQTTTVNPLLDLVGLLASRTTLKWLGIALLLILIPAHDVWILERGREDELTPHELDAKRYPSGASLRPSWLPHACGLTIGGAWCQSFRATLEI
jgi:hypothetical protein